MHRNWMVGIGARAARAALLATVTDATAHAGTGIARPVGGICGVSRSSRRNSRQERPRSPPGECGQTCMTVCGQPLDPWYMVPRNPYPTGSAIPPTSMRLTPIACPPAGSAPAATVDELRMSRDRGAPLRRSSA